MEMILRDDDGRPRGGDTEADKKYDDEQEAR
jgi:hypothetical protein